MAAEKIFSREDESQILASIESWLEKEVRPVTRQYEQADEYPHDLVEQMKELGLFGLTIPEAYGGMGLPPTTYAKIVTAIAEVFMSIGGIINSHLMLGTLIHRFGTEAQKDHFLPKLATGELRGALCLTEPDAGTDLQGIKTHAKRDGDHYVLNGSKMWITNGMYGSLYAVLTKTDLQAKPAHKGMTMFLAERGPGFTVDRKLKKLGYRSVESVGLSFNDFRISADRVLGGEEGHGFQHAVGGLELGRINIAARGVGIANAALKDSIRYSQQRKTFGKPICEHQAIQLKLGEMATRVEAARLLTDQAASKYERGERCDMEAGMAKLFASECALFCSQEAMRIHGGYGYSAEFDIERYYRDAPLMCIGEGTNEIQRIVIAKSLVKRFPI
jgi:alkylation response protein AidB-like acyl-CoA dehydrogenase